MFSRNRPLFTPLSSLIDSILLPPTSSSSTSSIQQLTTSFCTSYPNLNSTEKLETLNHLVISHGVDYTQISRQSQSPVSPAKLRAACIPKYEQLFSSILSSIPSGMDTIVKIRSDVRNLKSENRILDEVRVDEERRTAGRRAGAKRQL